MFLSKFFKNHLTIPQATDLFEEVKTQTHPDIADLKRLVGFHKAPVGTKDEMQALDLKYRAMTEAPSTIEKTMSEVQLFESNSPFWATDLTIAQIHDVLEAHKELIQQGYSDFMEYLLTTVREPNYNINYIGQQESALTFYYKLFNSL